MASYLERIASEAHRLSHDTRDFIWTLDPRVDSLHDLLLHLEEFGRELFERSETAFSLRGLREEHRSVKLPMETRRQVALLLKEALHNAMKHAAATAVTLAITEPGPGEVRLEVHDDGAGFDPKTAREGAGLKSIESRARKAGAALELHAAPGAGTRVVVRLGTSATDGPPGGTS